MWTAQLALFAARYGGIPKALMIGRISPARVAEQGVRHRAAADRHDSGAPRSFALTSEN